MCAVFQVVVSGTGTHLGEDVSWQLRWRGDGAFTEQIKGRRLSFRWGFDGGVAGNTWEVNIHPCLLQLDLFSSMPLAAGQNPHTPRGSCQIQLLSVVEDAFASNLTSAPRQIQNAPGLCALSPPKIAHSAPKQASPEQA